MPATVSSLLKAKGHDVWKVSPSASVYEAAQLMVDKKVGAVLVATGLRVVGVLSERDYVSRMILPGRNARDVQVSEIMTSPVVVVTGSHTVDECMRLVTKRRVRHLPVVDGDNEQVVGIISIGDLVNSIIGEQGEIIQHLETYITGREPV